jgi:hypothetical protein
MDGVKQQDSTPQNDSTLGFKWIKYVQTQFGVFSSNMSMIIMYYEYMTTQYFVRIFLSI